MGTQGGRPTVMSKSTVLKLEQALRDGFSVGMACSVSGVSRSTFYAHLQSDAEFMNKMELSKSWATERAKQVIIHAIDKGDLKAAQWWLERKQRAEFSSNPPEPTKSNDNANIVNQYFGGNREKYLDFLQHNIDVLREVESKKEQSSQTNHN